MLWNIEFNVTPWQEPTRKLWLWVGLLLGGVLINFSPVVAIVAVGLSLYMGSDHKFGVALSRATFNVRYLPMMFLYFIIIIASSGLLAVTTSAVAGLFDLVLEENQPLVEILRTAPLIPKILIIFAVTITIPIAEELIFRRFLYAIILPWLGLWGAILATSLIFGAIHFFPLGFASLTFIGLFFQLVYIKYGNITYTIILHSLVNIWATILALNME